MSPIFHARFLIEIGINYKLNKISFNRMIEVNFFVGKFGRGGLDY